jgi:hypothetical protein
MDHEINYSKNILITLGCSWTFGVGVGYKPGMRKREFDKISYDPNLCDQYSFRKILADKYHCSNINFAHRGSSNQRQFRFIKEFLISHQCAQLLEQGANITVLHGITSTARTEMYINDLDQLTNIKFENPDFKKYSIFYLEHFYNHDNEVAKLAADMKFMNQYYRAVGIKNLWFDTFNHHDYPVAIDNLVETHPGRNPGTRDMLSTMALLNGLDEFDDNYHYSSWSIDSNRVKFLVDQGYLNPISKHPTKQGHALIADIIGKQLERIM